MKNTDIVVIGAGIAGASAAIYLKIVNANFIILEGDEFGGLLNELHNVENFPALGKTTGSKIKEDLKNQLDNFGVNVVKENVQTLLKNKNGFEVVGDKEIYNAKAVIVATGNSKVSKLIPGEEKYAGSGVSYCATCDGNFFKGRDVAVIGNQNTVLEESIYLAGIVNKVYVLCPDKLEGDEDLLNKLNNYKNVEIVEFCKVNEISGNEFMVNKVVTDKQEIMVDGVFPYIGKKSSSTLLQNISPLTKDGHVVVDENMKTNIEGLFAAGDIIDKKLRQLITASSDGACAAVSADLYVKELNKE